MRKARQRSRTVGGPMGPALFATSGPMGHERHEGPEVPTVTIHRPCVRLLSITLACCQEPVQTKETGRTAKEQARSQQSRSSTLLSIALLAGTKKEDEQQQRFLSLLRSSQHCLLPGRLFCFTFVKQLQAAARIARLVSFSWLGLRHLGSSGHPSCARRRTRSRLVYALRGLDVIYQATVCALRGSDVIYQRPRKSTPDEV